jgi:hypothetical protein
LVETISQAESIQIVQFADPETEDLSLSAREYSTHSVITDQIRVWLSGLYGM